MIIINKNRPIRFKIKGLIIIILSELRNDYNHTSAAEADLEHFWNCCSAGFLGEWLKCRAIGQGDSPASRTAVDRMLLSEHTKIFVPRQLQMIVRLPLLARGERMSIG